MATKSIRLTDGTDTLLPESATSASGYQKCADGTLICWGNPQIVANANTKQTYAVTFPVAFVSTPFVVAQGITGAPASYIGGVQAKSATGCTMVFQNVASGNATMEVVWIAIGRWK